MCRLTYCFSKKWESDLRGETPDYDTLKAEAKEELGLSEDSKPLIARYIAVKLTKRNPPVVPETVKKVIEKAIAAKHPGTCLSSMR